MLALAILALLAPVESTPVTDDDRETARVLASACVGETGWRDAEGCAAVSHVMVTRARARGWTVIRMTRAYNSSLRRPPRTRRWLTDLHDRERPPQGWAGASWPRARLAFRRLFKTALGVLTGDVANPCPGAEHHGGPRWLDADMGPRWERASCLPGRRQRFWKRR